MDLVDSLEDLVNSGDVVGCGTDTPPEFVSFLIDEQGGTDGNVFAFSIVTSCVQEAILSDRLCASVAQDGELAVYSLLPYAPSMGRVVHTNGENLDVPLIEIRFMLRELAQLAHAGWS